MTMTFTCGAVVIDLGEHLLRGSGGVVTLTKLEVALLGYLARHRGRTVPRDELLREVWGYAPRVWTRAVDKTVARLRKKLEDDPHRPRWLCSRWGVGYRLETEPSAPADHAQTLLERASDALQAGALAEAHRHLRTALSLIEGSAAEPAAMAS